MYRLTNLTLDTTTTYKNKDLVYQALERENAKVKHKEAEGMLLVEELDKKGVVIYQEDIYLPFDGIADSLFLTNGGIATADFPSKPNGSSFLKRSEKKDGLEEHSSLDKSESIAPLSDKEIIVKTPSSKLKILGRIAMISGLLGSLSLAAVATSLVVKQEKNLIVLSKKITELENFQEDAGKMDTFIRYFLPRYYSEQGQLSDFIDDNLKLTNQTGQLQSVILETSTQIAEKTYQLTYVLSIREGESKSHKRLIVTVKEVPSSPYGYLVITEPKLSDYPR